MAKTLLKTSYNDRNGGLELCQEKDKLNTLNSLNIY